MSTAGLIHRYIMRTIFTNRNHRRQQIQIQSACTYRNAKLKPQININSLTWNQLMYTAHITLTQKKTTTTTSKQLRSFAYMGFCNLHSITLIFLTIERAQIHLHTVDRFPNSICILLLFPLFRMNNICKTKWNDNDTSSKLYTNIYVHTNKNFKERRIKKKNRWREASRSVLFLSFFNDWYILFTETFLKFKFHIYARVKSNCPSFTFWTHMHSAHAHITEGKRITAAAVVIM